MPYRYLEGIATADIAFEAWGKDPEELFISSADATMNVMVERLESIRMDEQVSLELEHTDLDLLLFSFLNELVYYKDARRLLLRIRQISLQRENGKIFLHATTSGERLDPERHQLNVDVKAVTLHLFRVEQTDNGWKATVVLDI
ncbi:MAG: archease [Alphaproteobacteria bacterium]|uniref:Archease n=1 Tax=Candidatus Nitrobium versatile TaxID=2884831 RepID=A0A953J927_9BACT|nr:archease [Candidatus Nitrobium versatile]